jgi:hypothetical protein
VREATKKIKKRIAAICRAPSSRPSPFPVRTCMMRRTAGDRAFVAMADGGAEAGGSAKGACVRGVAKVWGRARDTVCCLTATATAPRSFFLSHVFFCLSLSLSLSPRDSSLERTGEEARARTHTPHTTLPSHVHCPASSPPTAAGPAGRGRRQRRGRGGGGATAARRRHAARHAVRRRLPGPPVRCVDTLNAPGVQAAHG